MNLQRLLKIIEDMHECIADIEECIMILETKKDDALIIKLSKSSLRQLFVSFHTILEDLCSIILKEIKKYKVGMSLYEALIILKDNGIIDEETYLFLEKSRLIRNRISHRYKEPSHEELLAHIVKYKVGLYKVLKVAQLYMDS
ncbi:MAG: HepT-like ribonuclease domain-containing protein [Clostridium sp.]